jgi:subtilisin family serine protease
VYQGLIVFFTSLLFFNYASAQCPIGHEVEDQFIVKIKEESALFSSKLNSSSLNYSVKSLIKKSVESGSSSFNSKLSQSYQTLVIETDDIESFKKQVQPEYVQQDCYAEVFRLSNDPFSVYQNWYLRSLGADNSFDLNTNQEVVVAVVDTGVDIGHEDLSQNLWTNTLELNGLTGVDDDGNGFVDDIYGYDVADNDNDPVPTRQDFFLDFDHGTHVAGLIGANFNNTTGIMGLARNQVKIMSVKGFKSLDRTPISDLLKGIYYAVDNGADIINASWGATKPAEQAEIDAIDYALSKEVLVVAAAGNSTEPASWVTPSSISGVVTVGSLNSNNQLSTFSNYGASVNFVAPGGDGRERLNEFIFSTFIENDYGDLRGTSMSAPLVSGALAFLMSQRAGLTPFMALRALNETASEFKLRPFTGRGEQIYRKPSLEQALNYIQDVQNISKLDPKLLTVVSEFENEGTVELSSNLKPGGTGGCGFQSSAKNSGMQGHSILVTLLLILPSLLTVLLRRKED